MAIPVAAITALVAAGVGIYSAISGDSKDKKARNAAFVQNLNSEIKQREMYEKEKADTKAAWDSQNAYNHPSQQMTRLRQAGLNPHLVYGRGADATAGSITPTSHKTYDPKALQYQHTDMSGIQSAISTYQDTRLKQAQTDNVSASTSLMAQESLLKQANTAKTIQETSRGKFDLEQAQALKDDVITAAKLQNEKTRADTSFTVNQDQRNELKNTSDLKMTAEKILTEKVARAKTEDERKMLQEQLAALKQSESIKQYHDQLTRMGIAPNDPWYFRALMNLVHGNIQPPSHLDGVIDKFRNFKHQNFTKKGAGGNW